MELYRACIYVTRLILFVILRCDIRQMTLSDLSALYRGVAQTKALLEELDGKRGGNVFLQGLRASSASLLFSELVR